MRSLVPEIIPNIVVNTESEDIPPFGIAEICGVSGGTSLDAFGNYRIKKPTAGNLTAIVFMQGGGLGADSDGPAWVTAGPVMVAYDTDDGDPDVGDEIGTKADSYLMSVDGSGWTCLAVDQDNGVAYVSK